MNWLPLLIKRLWWRRFNPVLRLGWTTIFGRGPDDARIGAFLIGAGWVLQILSRPKPELVYSYEALPGEVLRIKVIQGDRVVSDRIVET